MSNVKKGNIIEGQVTGITKYGVFVTLEDNYVGLVHISEVSAGFINDLNEKFKIGDIVKVKVLDIDEDKLQVKLSIKKIRPQTRKTTKIVEKGNGFQPLKDNLNIWVDETLKKI